MELLEKKDYYNHLFAFYGELLTLKQQEYFVYYYHNDYTLKEIAEMLAVSRNAVYDCLNNALNTLVYYEKKLLLQEKKTQRLLLLTQYELEKDETLLQKLRKMDEDGN